MKHRISTLLLLIVLILAGAVSAQAVTKGAKKMKGKVLVTYSSTAGSTAEIAQYIGKEIQSAGWEADIKPISSKVNPAAYTAVIIGSPIYMGRWKKDATAFIAKHQVVLKQKHVAYFAVGMFFADPDKKEQCKNYLVKERAILQPVSEGHFMGRINYSRLECHQKLDSADHEKAGLNTVYTVYQIYISICY